MSFAAALLCKATAITLPLALWRDAAHKAPLMPTAHYNHGYALHRRRQYR